jgi:hypothetical protein
MKVTAFAAALLAVASYGPGAAAYCRATNCFPEIETCTLDKATQCPNVGTPLSWFSGCVDLYVQADGCPSQGISFATTKSSVERAVATWLSASCADGGTPSLSVNVLGPITCHTSEYGKDAHNANIVMFRENDWPYVGAEDTIGFTHVRFGVHGDGEIWDGDIELNAFDFAFSVGDKNVSYDLDSVLTHEIGHWLGLAHTADASATMYGEYTPGMTQQRSLADDDSTAICEVYPTGRTTSTESCDPRHGFSDLCGADQPAEQPLVGEAPRGCGLAHDATSGAASLAFGLLLLFGRVARSKMSHSKNGRA